MVDIPNYYERCVALLASQFQIVLPDNARTNFQKMLFAFCTMAQFINTQETLLQTMRYLATAQGVQLDGIGEILGLARVPGQSDDSYREALQFQIFINNSSGTPEEVIAILQFLTKALKIWYDEVYPASYIMTTNGLIFPANPSDLIGFLQSVSPAGVEFSAVIAIYNFVPFVFSDDPIVSQLFVAPNPNFPNQINPFQADPGSGPQNFYVNTGQTVNPDFGGGFAEAIGVFPTYVIDTTGAGQMSEAIQN